MVTEAALRQLARASEMMPLQAQAAIHIDAAEHALNRLIAECAKVGCTVMQPTFEPMRQLVSEPAAQPIRQSMAA